MHLPDPGYPVASPMATGCHRRSVVQLHKDASALLGGRLIRGKPEQVGRSKDILMDVRILSWIRFASSVVDQGLAGMPCRDSIFWIS
jgi:hypothetical protein